ncbi:hypothetical protein [Aquipseudomonas guryensis]|jgi:hypothetical protein|uniref:Lipoprotein n=1 Tax=Aquipseudomonas guryensis TaxID=2759165 RepID=A0A7W4H6G7_9GAMM|nr:hypothetical protein [Pseudomonas guryensis]MBB1521337.1 hypothetical protein [Pseudomonas guryensis]
MKKFAYLLVLVLCAGVTGCSFNHPIAEDYGTYLNNTKGQNNLPKAISPAEYELATDTQTHHYEFRSATVGYAHLWVVDFGKVLDATLESTDVQQAFGTLQPKHGSAGPLLTFELQDYRFENFRAYVTLNIEVTSAGQSLFKKAYKVEGNSQGGKMFWGGPFAMKNAIQQSTKLALDEILRDFIKDFNQLNLAKS